MSKKVIVILGVIVIGVITAIFLNYEKGSNSKDNKAKDEFDNEISIKDLNKLNKNKEDVFVYFYQTNCSYCKKSSPIIDNLDNELNLKLRKINLEKEPKGWKEFMVGGTPTIIKYEKGKEVLRIEGLKEKDEYKNWFENK